MVSTKLWLVIDRCAHTMFVHLKINRINGCFNNVTGCRPVNNKYKWKEIKVCSLKITLNITKSVKRARPWAYKIWRKVSTTMSWASYLRCLLSSDHATRLIIVLKDRRKRREKNSDGFNNQKGITNQQKIILLLLLLWLLQTRQEKQLISYRRKWCTWT